MCHAPLAPAPRVKVSIGKWRKSPTVPDLRMPAADLRNAGL